MQRLVEQFDDPAYVVSFDGGLGKVMSWNRAAERALGYAAEEAIGHRIDEVLRGITDARSRLRRIVEMRRRGSWHGRTVLRDQHDRPTPFEGGCIRLVGGTDYLTVLRFRPVDFATSLREFAESGAQSEQRSFVEHCSAWNGDETMVEDAKQHRRDKIAHHLQRLREEKGLTQKQLERQLNATSGHVSRWESALWEPGPVWLAKLAEFFGVEEAEFFREPAPC